MYIRIRVALRTQVTWVEEPGQKEVLPKYREKWDETVKRVYDGQPSALEAGPIDSVFQDNDSSNPGAGALTIIEEVDESVFKRVSSFVIDPGDILSGIPLRGAKQGDRFVVGWFAS